MKFQISIIIAFVLTAVILFTNANETIFFEKGQARHKGIDINSEEFKELSSLSYVYPANYAESIANEISNDRLISILSSSVPSNSCIQAFHIEDEKRSPKPLVAMKDEMQLIPASTNKLVTAAVVFSSLDPDSTLDTSLIAENVSPTLKNGYIKTSGDPSFVSTTTPPERRPDYLSPANVRTFDDFADSTYKKGVRSIDKLVIDDAWFALANVEPGWANDKAEVGQISAFNIDEGFDGNGLAANPRDKTASVLKSVFNSKGITINSISFGPIPTEIDKDENVISKTSSASIKDLVSDMLKTSDNVYAEQLLAAAVHTENKKVDTKNRELFVVNKLKELNIDSSNYFFKNGSGYSKDARSTCKLNNDVVNATNKKHNIDLTKIASVAGQDGTLAKRFTNLDKPLTGKTGTLNNVTALTATLDESTIFSFITNASFSEEQGKAYQEVVVSNLSNFPFVKVPKFNESVNQ